MARRHPLDRFLLASLAALLLAGCGRGAALTAVSVPSSTVKSPSKPAIAPSPEAKVILPEQAGHQEAVPDEIIVRFSGEPRPLAGATLDRALDLPGTYVYRLNQAGYNLQAAESWEDAEDILYVEPNYLYTATAEPNDPRMAEAWGVGAVRAPLAWEASTGEGITVAVVDTGVNPNHPDLAGHVLPGADMVNKDRDAADDHGHGTHVAGTIAAIANNLQGVAGVAPEAKILPIKVLAANGAGTNGVIANGILEAAKMGAKVINLSLGGPDSSETLKAAIASVQRQGVIVVAAAGNDNVNTPFYPAAYDGVIGVAAVDPACGKASFSNYGDYVDIAGPGTNILSTGYAGGYVKLSGTSMASPHVAGAAALLLAKYPRLTASHITKLMQATGKVTSGFGMTQAPRLVDVAAALDAAPTMDVTPPGLVPGLTATPGAPGEVTLTWSPAVDNVGVAGYRVFRDGELLDSTQSTRFSDAGLREGQKVTYTVAAYDQDGNEGPAGQGVVGTGGKPSELFDGLRVSKRGTQDLTLTWTTSEPVRCYVQYGTKPNFGTGTPLESAASTKHTIQLTGLSRFKKYYYRVVSTDAQGQHAYSATETGRTKLWLLF